VPIEARIACRKRERFYFVRQIRDRLIYRAESRFPAGAKRFQRFLDSTKHRHRTRALVSTRPTETNPIDLRANVPSTDISRHIFSGTLLTAFQKPSKHFRNERSLGNDLACENSRRHFGERLCETARTVRVIRRLLLYGLSLFCINATKGGTMFAKFKLKYDAGEVRSRGILKGTHHLVGNTTSSFLHLIFSLPQAAPLVERGKTVSQG